MATEDSGTAARARLKMTTTGTDKALIVALLCVKF
jgi:hypothetical protein